MCAAEPLVRTGLEQAFFGPEGGFLMTWGSVDVQLTPLSLFSSLSPRRYCTPAENSREQARPGKQATAGVSLCDSLVRFIGKYSRHFCTLHLLRKWCICPSCFSQVKQEHSLMSSIITKGFLLLFILFLDATLYYFYSSP